MAMIESVVIFMIFLFMLKIQSPFIGRNHNIKHSTPIHRSVMKTNAS